MRHGFEEYVWIYDTLGSGYPTSWNIDFVKIGFETRTVWNPEIFAGFRMAFDKMEPICPDFKWLGFQISDSIWNPDHLQPNLF